MPFVEEAGTVFVVAGGVVVVSVWRDGVHASAVAAWPRGTRLGADAWVVLPRPHETGRALAARSPCGGAPGVREQMKVRSSTRATSPGFDRTTMLLGRFSGASGIAIPAKTISRSIA